MAAPTAKMSLSKYDFFTKLLSFVYAIAFISVFAQIPALWGDVGIEPATELLARRTGHLPADASPLAYLASLPSLVALSSFMRLPAVHVAR